MVLSLDEILRQSAARHDHLCPRQVLGARMALTALEMLGLAAPLTKPTGLIIAETDGCFIDGLEVATGATPGHRTLRIHDLGKVAATFVHVKSERAIRLSPRSDARLRAVRYAPETASRYQAQLRGYELMPAQELFRVQEVLLDPPLAEILSEPEARAACTVCGEEIINEREVMVKGMVLCQTCAHGAYYHPVTARQDSISKILLSLQILQG